MYHGNDEGRVRRAVVPESVRWTSDDSTAASVTESGFLKTLASSSQRHELVPLLTQRRYVIRAEDDLPPRLADYGRIPIAFEVREVLGVSNGADGRFSLVPRRVAKSCVKDYDALGTRPEDWAACRFYARQGCVLVAADRGAYVDLPDEIQLLWYKTLGHQQEPTAG